MTIGERIKALRIKQGLTQRQLGEMCDPPIHEVQLRKYERVEVTPKMQNACRIANALKVPVSELLGESLEAIEYEARTEHYSPFMKYLGSLGYQIYSDRDSKSFGDETIYVPNGGYSVSSPNGERTVFTSEQFRAFEKAIADSVDYQVWQQNHRK